ncbi:hypothetical protein ACS0TY_015030 [Phlomoides rotata]
MESILAQNVGLEEEAIWRPHMNSWHNFGHLIRSKRNAGWGIPKKPRIELVKPAKSLSNSDKVDEDGRIEEHSKLKDEDESEDGFFNPDGSLSKKEGVEVDGDMETGELIHEGRHPPGSEKQVQSEEFSSQLMKQKYLNHLTEHALKKNLPLIIMNLTQEKTTSVKAFNFCISVVRL